MVLTQLRESDLIDFLRYGRVTGARVFHRDGELHLILGSVDRDVERDTMVAGGGTPKTSGTTTSTRPLRVEEEIGSRSQPRPSAAAIVLPEGGRFQSPGRTDWIVLDIDRAPGTAARPPAPAPPVAASGRPPQGAAGTTPPQPPGDAGAETIERRLERLRALHEQGLIDDALYEEKKREVLQRYLDAPQR